MISGKGKTSRNPINSIYKMAKRTPYSAARLKGVPDATKRPGAVTVIRYENGKEVK